MKGVLLAGGTGSRLHPLTRITNKHLLPVYDRPMIHWAIEALVKAGIRDLLLVSGGGHMGDFMRLLGDGHEFGLDHLSYAVQEQPGGIAQALGLAEPFAGGEPVVVMLGDNIFERSIRPMVVVSIRAARWQSPPAVLCDRHRCPLHPERLAQDCPRVAVEAIYSNCWRGYRR